MSSEKAEACRAKKLFTPGPLSCTMSVKEAMLRDFGSRDDEFTAVIKDVRKGILELAGVSEEEWTVVLLQGSGTYCVEAAIHTAVPKDPQQLQRVLVLSNGAYGRRLAQICACADLPHDVVEFGDALPYDLALVDRQLAATPYRAVVAVHCETSTGLVNPVASVFAMARAAQPGAVCVVDAMSGFGALPLRAAHLDLLVATANKCVQGVPGFGFVVARRATLDACKGNARTLCLDLWAQQAGLSAQGQFRFTPPTHALLAAQRALHELRAEGGREARLRRYQANGDALLRGARALGLRTLLPADSLSPIITAFHYPAHRNFDFVDFYRRLSDLGQVIYPGKVTTANCFRVGCIGDLQPSDIEYLIQCMEQVFKDMGIPVPVS